MNQTQPKSQRDDGENAPNWGTLGTAGASFAAEISIENLSHHYAVKTPALQNINLAVKPGEIMALLGASGSGKSTLLRIIAGLEEQVEGRILFDKREIARPGKYMPAEKRSVGLVFQDFALFPHMSVRKNVEYGLSKLPAKVAHQVAENALHRVGMLKHAEKYPHMLSGGEQQRVALARAIAPRPRVILMDEPFSGLDSRLRERVRAETVSLIKETGATCIIVTHDAEEAMMMADQVALLSKGQVLDVGAPADLYNRPQSLEAARFFTPLNEFVGVVEAGHVQTPLGRIPAPGLDEGIEAVVCVRYTGIVVEEASEERGILARVIRQRFTGENILVELALPGVSNLVRAKIRAGRQIKGDVRISLDPLDVLTFASGG